MEPIVDVPEVERYECTRCGERTFYAIIESDGLAFLRCASCDRVVDQSHHSMYLEDG